MRARDFIQAGRASRALASGSGSVALNGDAVPSSAILSSVDGVPRVSKYAAWGATLSFDDISRMYGRGR